MKIAMRGLVAVLVMVVSVGFSAPSGAVDLDDYVIRKSVFQDIKISPDGTYYAASVPLPDRTAIAILRREDMKVTASFSIGKHKHVIDFDWANDNRLLMSTAEKIGTMDLPRWTGDIYATNADGGKTEVLVGQSVDVMSAGTRIRGKQTEMVAAFLVDPLPHDEKNVVISVSPFSQDPYSRAEIMHVDTGRRNVLARAPVQNGRFTTDNTGTVRVVRGFGVDNANKLYVRDGRNAEWLMINDEALTGRIMSPLGFSEDNRVLYLQVQHDSGPDSIVAMDVESGDRTELLRDVDVSPERIIYRAHTRIPVGAFFQDGKPRTAFFDAASPEARQYRSLEEVFPGQNVLVTSSTRDDRYALVEVSSDQNPGDFYLFDAVEKKADLVISRRDWFYPDDMATMRPVSLVARDGLRLHGYLTVPNGADGKNMPLVVMPHGGPFGIFDRWGFDDEAQLLAAAGYGVLQINFRGSGNYGRGFHQAGARQWGGKMQDDLTDATRWAIEQGFADRNRICMYGHSYGAYATMMGLAREPDLYKCGIGSVGVYDLPMLYTAGDLRRGSDRTYVTEWIGERDRLAEVSPTNMADRIRVPVLLAAGGEDLRAPVAHTELMERRLRAAGVPVESLYFRTEGHGFYNEANRREYYTKLLAFLSRHIGGKTAGAATSN